MKGWATGATRRARARLRFARVILAGMAATEEELKRALKAFRKRWKVTQLDEDSRLGHSPLTGSRTTIVSIMPPAGFTREVWEELADKGILKRDVGGSYGLVPGK
jgi:hypothetical protein